MPSLFSDFLNAVGPTATSNSLLFVLLVCCLPGAVLKLLAGIVAVLGRDERRCRRAVAVLRLLLDSRPPRRGGSRRPQ